MVVANQYSMEVVSNTQNLLLSCINNYRSHTLNRVGRSGGDIKICYLEYIVAEVIVPCLKECQQLRLYDAYVVSLRSLPGAYGACSFWSCFGTLENGNNRRKREVLRKKYLRSLNLNNWKSAKLLKNRASLSLKKSGCEYIFTEFHPSLWKTTGQLLHAKKISGSEQKVAFISNQRWKLFWLFSICGNFKEQCIWNLFHGTSFEASMKIFYFGVSSSKFRDLMRLILNSK